MAGDDDDQPKVRSAAERALVEQGDLLRPEVLVLDVDQGASTAEHLPVDTGDASLAVGGERVGGSFGGIGAKDLDRVSAGRRRWCSVRRDRNGNGRLLRGSRDDPGQAKPASLEGRRVVPAL